MYLRKRMWFILSLRITAIVFKKTIFKSYNLIEFYAIRPSCTFPRITLGSNVK